jgi:hypothetical protein
MLHAHLQKFSLHMWRDNKISMDAVHKTAARNVRDGKRDITHTQRDGRPRDSQVKIIFTRATQNENLTCGPQDLSGFLSMIKRHMLACMQLSSNMASMRPCATVHTWLRNNRKIIITHRLQSTESVRVAQKKQTSAA